MKLKFAPLKQPIRISLKDFILDEKFDCLKLGVTKSWLQNNFVEPDDIFANSTLEESPVWRYGNIELHFIEDKLWMIFTDYVDDLDGGDKLILDKWILNGQNPLKISDWVQELNRNIKNYSIVHSPEYLQTKLILNTEDEGVVLTFSDNGDDSVDPNQYTLNAIQLCTNTFS